MGDSKPVSSFPDNAPAPHIRQPGSPQNYSTLVNQDLIALLLERDHQLQQRDEDVDELRNKLVAVRKLALESRDLGSKSSDLALKMFDEAEL